MLEFLRKFSLLMLLFVVGLSSYLSAQNATDWKETLWIDLHPINGDGLKSTANYIDSLTAVDFKGVERFMEREAARYGITVDRPVRMNLGPTLNTTPPEPPFGANFLRIGLWSLEMRWWTHKVTSHLDRPTPDVTLFLVYFDPEEKVVLEHSVGLQKGRVGIVNAFANDAQRKTNNFVVAHEMLHTLGASDKYGPPDMLPVFPAGYAEPDKTPRYPQTKAELMGGRIPVTAEAAKMPDGLRNTVVGPDTAVEIRWIQ
ncbi:MAG: hypothetical protein HKN56_07515 [Gammaproteobacteria bacterium]|nr:hypothetical protein [Gammaproteobacteria bacterium]